jgi:glycosyltransferase involved in cell wall biosynthesis
VRIGFDTLVENPLRPSSAINYLKSVLRAMAVAAPDDDIFVFVSPKNRRLFEIDQPNVRLINCFVSNEHIVLRILVQQLYYPLLAWRLRLDAIHALSQIPLWSPCATVVKTCGLHHHLTPEEYSGVSLGHRLRLLYRRVVWDASVRRATLVMANSLGTQREIVRLMGVPVEKIRVVYESVDDAFGSVPADAARTFVSSTLGLDRPYVLYVSNLWKYKNPDGAIRAFARQRDTYGDDLDLVIAGPDDYGRTEELTRLAAELGIADRVRFLGRVPFASLLNLYAAAHVIFYPSRFETFGKPVVEGMRAGVPVVAARATCLPEIVGDAGLTADPDDDDAMAETLHAAASDLPLRVRLIANGHRRGAEFSWERTAQATVEMCRDAARIGAARSGASTGTSVPSARTPRP